MFNFIARGQLPEELKAAASISPSIIKRIDEMGENPLSKAIKTEMPIIGEYYVNAGRHCILFDVYLDNEQVEIRAVVQASLLHRIMTGKIGIPQKLLETTI